MSEFKNVNLATLTPGARLRTADGAIAEVADNPLDGTWIICRYLEHPTSPGLLDGKEHAIFATDIESVL
ncbi:hypothetical protein BTL55_05720 [Bordetella trematum]|uniref:hypothetical protein n=1 Tax=Bordetella trematum TaxID=123899 RepID=UPI000C7852F9|nr:hypothetical protein [Bordetella trematum]AUL46530.1 hypothetical protein BTL55_05720 [Bordetella trematum]